jgi:Cu/Ag efflux protein CusF
MEKNVQETNVREKESRIRIRVCLQTYRTPGTVIRAFRRCGTATHASSIGLNMPHRLKSFSAQLALLCLLAFFTLSAACNHGNPQAAAKHYPLKGKVISIDKQAQTASINNDPIPGFMDPMVMPYSIKPPTALNQLHPGDSITADVVVAEPGKYWLENVQTIGHDEPSVLEKEERKKEKQ